MVLGSTASFRGQVVELSDSEEKEVARIILGAIQKRVQAQLSELFPKTATPEVAGPPKKRRGRPPKVKPSE